ncbi:MAG: Mur ligase family protein, partial [bacterium]|nr:Mur ligase family protein [bacterium]
MDLRSKIGILGFGIEGRAMFDYLYKKGYKNLTICDQNLKLGEDFPKGVSVSLGPNYLNDLKELDIIFRSPGIPFLNSQIQSAKALGVELTSATKYFMDMCPCPVIGVTGTKGKGTTCNLIYEMLKKSGLSPYLGGNIGNPPVEFLDKLKGDDIVVLELSSFQLQDLEKSPRYGVILNTTSDHLDYHVDRDEYLHAKENLLTHQHKDCLAILNKDYEYHGFYSQLVKGRLKWVSVKGKVDGAYVKGDSIYCGDEKIADVSEVKLVGSHNLENIL